MVSCRWSSLTGTVVLRAEPSSICGSDTRSSWAIARASRSRSTLAARAFGTALSCCRPYRRRMRRSSVTGWSPPAMIAAGLRLTDVRAGLSPHRVQGARAQSMMRTFCGRHVVAALLVVAVALPARAQETCSVAFTQWVKLSETRIGKRGGDQGVDRPGDPKVTCIAGEPQRQELL